MQKKILKMLRKVGFKIPIHMNRRSDLMKDSGSNDVYLW